MSTMKQYILLIEKFVSGEINASQFEELYLEIFKNEADNLPENIYFILNQLFLDVDSYCNDPGLRDEEDINDEQLLNSAKRALQQLI